MGYQFRPPGAPDIDVRKLGLLFLIIVSVLVLYAVGTVVTGYSTYSASLEQELNATKEELRIMTAAREDCAQTLQNTNAQYNSCSSALQSANSNLAGCSNQLNATNAAYDECRSEVESLQVESFEPRYNALVKNSIKSICCTLADVDSGASKNWDIVNDKIVCSGNYTVNCATGEANYP